MVRPRLTALALCALGVLACAIPSASTATAGTPTIAGTVAAASTVVAAGTAGTAATASTATAGTKVKHRAAHSVRVCHRTRHHRRRHRCAASKRARHGAAKHSHGRNVAAKRSSPAPSTAPGSRPSSGGATPQTPAPSGGSGAPLLPEAPGGALASPEPVAASPTPARVQVIAREYSFTLSRPVVPAGPVIIEFLNAGEDPHNMHVDPGSGEPESGAFANTPAGTHVDQKFVLRAGTYTFFCSLPSHRAKGMEATFRVQ